MSIPISRYEFTIPAGVRNWSVHYVEVADVYRVSLDVAYDVLSVRGSSLAYLSGHGAATDLQVAINIAEAQMLTAIAEENKRLAALPEIISRKAAPEETDDDLLALLGLDYT